MDLLGHGCRRVTHWALLVVLLGSGRPGEARPVSCSHPSLEIYKSSGTLFLYCGKKPQLQAPVTFGKAPQGHKQRSGDQRTPEGQYAICGKHRSQRFYKFLTVDYPRPADIRRALKKRLINKGQVQSLLSAHKKKRCPPWSTPLGGAIGIHGVPQNLDGVTRIWTALSRLGGLHQKVGFSEGCIVLANPDMDRIWPLVHAGTPLRIFPVSTPAPQPGTPAAQPGTPAAPGAAR